jgi:hypothetical protein
VSEEYLTNDEIDNIDELEFVEGISVDEVNEYLTLTNKISSRIALGVMICVLSPVVLVPITGFVGTYATGTISNLGALVGVAFLIGMLCIAVMVYLSATMKWEDYEYIFEDEAKMQPGVESMIRKQKDIYAPIYRRNIIIGMVICIIGIIPVILGVSINLGVDGEPEDLMQHMIPLFATDVTLILVSIGIYRIAKVKVMWDSYMRLLREDTHEDKKERHKKLVGYTILYVAIILAIYLLISLGWGNWSRSWYIWPIALVAYVAVVAYNRFKDDIRSGIETGIEQIEQIEKKTKR